MQADKILIIDFGSQYTKLIARKVRECGVYSEVISCLSEISSLKNGKTLKGIILSGGPSSVYVKDAPTLSKRILELNLPILGICYGLPAVAPVQGKSYKRQNKGVRENEGQAARTLEAFQRFIKRAHSMDEPFRQH